METKTALITGITGQDGQWLTELLTGKGYDVTGLTRKVTRPHMVHYPEIADTGGVTLISGDITSSRTMNQLAMRKFDEIYHLASQSDVAYSFSYPDETYDININGTLNLLNAVRDYSPNSRVYFAGSSEMFGQPKHTPQNEEYPMRPRSPYGVSKLSGYWSSKVYREAYGLFIACGILYNHESEIRGPNFVTRKISIGIAQYLKTGQPFSLGNIQARKDWGYAPDYVKGMWMMMQRDEPDDFVMGTGEMHTVREFLEESLKVADIDFKFKDRGDFVGYYDNVRGKWFVTVSKELYRPSEADNYLADITKARNILGWEPTTDFRTLVEKMVVNDISNIE